MTETGYTPDTASPLIVVWTLIRLIGTGAGWFALLYAGLYALIAYPLEFGAALFAALMLDVVGYDSAPPGPGLKNRSFPPFLPTARKNRGVRFWQFSAILGHDSKISRHRRARGSLIRR